MTTRACPIPAQSARRLAIAGLLLLIAADARAQQPVNVSQVGGASPVSAICDDPAKVTSVNINLTAGTGNTEIVALDGDDIIYVCGYTLIVGGADTPQWIKGTGTACATDEADVETFNFPTAGDGIAVPNAGHVQFKTAAGEALCLERTNSVTLVGRVTYVQQP